jgi:hypothetical protein
MRTRNPLAAAALLAVAVSSVTRSAQAVEPTLLFSSHSPSNPLVLGDGNVLVGSRGLAANSGGVFFVDSHGDLATVIGGLPYAGALAYRAGDANGDRHVDIVDVFYLISFFFAKGPEPLPAALEPDGLASHGSTLFVATGELVAADKTPSPDRGAVLSIAFSAGLGFQEPFFLQPADYTSLRAGQTVVLKNFTDNTASVKLVVNGVPSVSNLTVDVTTQRLYIGSRAESTVSFVPLP